MQSWDSPVLLLAVSLACPWDGALWKIPTMQRLTVQLKSPSLCLEAVRSLRGFGQLARYVKTNENYTCFLLLF